MVKVTIEGTVEQIVRSIDFIQIRHRAKKGESENAKRQARIVAQRAILREAFFLIRNDPAEKAMVDNLGGALGGSREMTTSLLESAKQIISKRRK